MRRLKRLTASVCGVGAASAALMLTLPGCSSGGRHFDGWEEALEIDVRANDSKLFIYRLASPHGGRPLVEVYRSTRAQDRTPRHEPMDARALEGLRKDADTAVSATGYCREGFLMLDYRLSHVESWLRGECREGATEADRKRFADKTQLVIPEPES